jgi:HK97 family phage portal protein
MSLWKNRERRALPLDIDPYQITARPYYPNYSGEIVTESSAFSSSAFLSAVSIISDSIASMPLELYRKKGDRIESLPTPSVLIKPNEHQTMFEFIHQTVLSLTTFGCAYIYAPRQPGELPVEMVNIHPNKIKDIYSDTDSSFGYEINKEFYSTSQIKGIHWIVLPGRRRGISPLEANRNSIGTAMAMDRFLAQFYGEGATPSSVLETDGSLTQEQAELVRRNWEDSHYKHRRPAVLTSGLRWKPIVTSAADQQMLEHREALVRDIARAYRVPLHLINGTGGDSQTYQNVESAGINFVRYTLLPWMRRIEVAISDLLPMPQQVKFNADEFQRADLMTRARAQQLQIMSGTLTPNEAREAEDREPYEGGDQFILGVAGAVVAGVEGGALPTLGTDALPPER